MKTRDVFRVLSIKHAEDVLWDIDALCKKEEYPSFVELSERLNLNKETLRRITNRLSRVGLIKSVKSVGRQRVYVICDSELNECLFSVGAYLYRKRSR